MKAQHLAAYFKKRLARPIPYDVYIERSRGGVIFWAYELEVTAVDGDMLHMMVTLKGVHDMQGRWLQRQESTCGDIVIPMNDGDCVTLLLGMAVAIRGVAERMDCLPPSSGLHLCYREYASRVEDDFNQPWSPPGM